MEEGGRYMVVLSTEKASQTGVELLDHGGHGSPVVGGGGEGGGGAVYGGALYWESLTNGC